MYGMLFDRFVFVLYLLLCYNWFLIGHVYDVWLKYVILVLIILSLLSIIFISIFEMQTIFKKDGLKGHQKWATIAWATVHIILAVLIFADSIQAANILAIGMLIALLLTVVIIIVATCACYVIILNGNEWYSHVHMTCISFWVMAQFWSIRLPSEELKYLATMPVVMMALLRFINQFKYVWRMADLAEMAAWSLCIILHIFCDYELVQKTPFLWATVITVTILIVLNRHTSSVIVLAVLPFVTIGILLYLMTMRDHGDTFNDTIQKAKLAYEQYVEEPERLPFEQEEEDFETPL